MNVSGMNGEETKKDCQTFGILWGFGCGKDGYNIHCTRRRWLFLLSMLFLLQCYFNVSVYINLLQSAGIKKLQYFTTWVNDSGEFQNSKIRYYKYPIIINSSGISMSFEEAHNTSYYWFVAMKPWFKYLGDDEYPKYTADTPTCELNTTNLGPIHVKKTDPTLEWVEQQNPDVKAGGSYAPAHCRAKHRVAIIVPYRYRKTNLAIFLRYIHPLLKKQLLEYRIFVVEQYGDEKFNKGTLYNIAFLETQRFGSWDCLIFHDVDLIPEDERIPYWCQENPTHMSSAVEAFGYALPYRLIFGGVTSLTPKQFESVNGYSNFYWNWGAEDDDFYNRLQANNYTVVRYNSSIARYASLPHRHRPIGNERGLLLMLSKLRARKEGLISTKYNLLDVTKEKLYTHLLADVNPTNISLDTKTLLQEVINIQGTAIEVGRHERELMYPSSL